MRTSNSIVDVTSYIYKPEKTAPSLKVDPPIYYLFPKILKRVRGKSLDFELHINKMSFKEETYNNESSN